MHGSLTRQQMLQWKILFTCVAVVQYGVAMAERSAFCVLPSYSHWMVCDGQSGEGKCFGRRPVQRRISGSHFATMIEQLSDLGVRFKALRQSRLRFQQFGKFLRWNMGRHFLNLVLGAAGVTSPNAAKLFGRQLIIRLPRRRQFTFEVIAVSRSNFLRLLKRYTAVF